MKSMKFIDSAIGVAGLDDLRGAAIFHHCTDTNSCIDPSSYGSSSSILSVAGTSETSPSPCRLPYYRSVECSQRLEGQCILTDIKAPMPALPEKPEAAE